MFQVNGKSLKFSLAHLSDIERHEVSELITGNGGEICEVKSPPSITFSGSNYHTEEEIVLHVSYVHECIRHGKLIEADNFNITDKWPKIQEDKMYFSVDNDVKMQVECTKTQKEEYSNGCSAYILTSDKQASCKIENENINSQEKSAPIALADFIIIRRWEGGRKRHRISGENTSPNRKVGEINSLDVDKKQVETSSLQPSRELKESSFYEKENVPLCQRLQRLQSSGAIDSNCDSISRQISPTNFKTQDRFAKKKLSNDETPTYDSRVAVGPLIPKDDSNKENILGERRIREPLCNIVGNTSIPSDSDETFYDPDIPVIIDSERRSSVDRSSPLRSRETGSEKEDEEETRVTNNGQRNGGESDLTKESEKNNPASFNAIDVSTDSDDERNSSISTSSDDDDSYSYSNSSSSSSSSDELPRSKRKNTSHEIGGRDVKRRWKSNFLAWEQREMVDYLINSNNIQNAKGYKIWKQMINDGFLPHRTFHSLNNHFRRSILPKIDYFEMSSEAMREFLALRNL